MVIAEGKANGRCERGKAIMKPWQRMNEQTGKMGWPHERLPLLGVGKCGKVRRWEGND